MRFLWYPIVFLIKVLELVLCSCHFRVGKLILPKGPIIIVANHLSWADVPFLAATFFPRRISFMAKEELFRFLPGRIFVRGMGSFPVHRGKFDRQAIRKSYEVLRKGLVLGIFPEGTRSPDAQMQRGEIGVALIALRSGATLIPVGITGTEKFERKLAWIFQHPRVTVTYGQPFQLPVPQGKLTRSELESLTDFIMRRIAELLPQSYQGIYRKDGQQREHGTD